jgi:hypothetical protein
VTTFTDFLEVLLNKFFRFTRDIACASPNVTVSKDMTSPIITLDYISLRFGQYIGVGWGQVISLQVSHGLGYYLYNKEQICVSVCLSFYAFELWTL